MAEGAACIEPWHEVVTDKRSCEPALQPRIDRRVSHGIGVERATGASGSASAPRPRRATRSSSRTAVDWAARASDRALVKIDRVLPNIGTRSVNSDRRVSSAIRAPLTFRSSA